MFSWFFRWWYRRKLRSEKSIAHKLKLHTQKLKSECVLELKNYFRKPEIKLEELTRKLDIKKKKMEVINTSKNEFGAVSERPAMSEEDRQRLKSLNKIYWFILILFVLAEGGLYFLTAQVFMPGASDIAKIILALFLASVVMFLMNFAFEKHFEFRRVLDYKEQLQISEGEIKNHRDSRTIGYALGIFGIFITVAAAFVRIYFLEQMDLTGYTQGEIDNLKLVGSWASYLTLAVTIALGIFLAVLKQQQLKNYIAYKVYKKLLETIKKENIYTQSKIQTLEQLKNQYIRIVQKYWQLVKGLEEIWGIEYDDPYKELFFEYKKLKSQGNIVLDRDSIEKYQDILYADFNLFESAVRAEADIDDILLQNSQMKSGG